MIEFFIGKPGDGKTMRAVRMMLEHFRREDDRFVVTNIRLCIPEIITWLAKNSRHNAIFWYSYIEIHYQCLFDETHLPIFYRFRGNIELKESLDINVPAFGRIKNGKEETFPNFGLVTKGVVYYLDEIHIAFGARN